MEVLKLGATARRGDSAHFGGLQNLRFPPSHIEALLCFNGRISKPLTVPPPTAAASPLGFPSPNFNPVN